MTILSGSDRGQRLTVWWRRNKPGLGAEPWVDWMIAGTRYGGSIGVPISTLLERVRISQLVSADSGVSTNSIFPAVEVSHLLTAFERLEIAGCDLYLLDLHAFFGRPVSAAVDIDSDGKVVAAVDEALSDAQAAVMWQWVEHQTKTPPSQRDLNQWCFSSSRWQVIHEL